MKVQKYEQGVELFPILCGLKLCFFLKENLKFLNFFNFLRLQRNKIFSFISPAHIFNISFDLDLFAD